MALTGGLWPLVCAEPSRQPQHPHPHVRAPERQEREGSFRKAYYARHGQSSSRGRWNKNLEDSGSKGWVSVGLGPQGQNLAQKRCPVSVLVSDLGDKRFQGRTRRTDCSWWANQGRLSRGSSKLSSGSQKTK